MATKKSYIYEIIIDTKKGTASINGAAVSLDKLEGKIRQVQKEANKMGNSLGQGASKAGLAGAAIVEMGRTISDSNYGILAMTNNIQQLSTLLVTLVATTGGVKNAFSILKTQLLGPLGIIVLFQILFAVIERFSMNARKATSTVKKLIKSSDALKISTRSLTDEMRKQLKVSDDLNKSESERLLNQVLALETEQTRAQISLDKLKEEEKIQQELDKFYGRSPEENPRIQALKAEVDEYGIQIARLKGFLTGKGGDSEGDRESEKKAGIYEPAELSFFSELFDLDVQKQLQDSSLAGLEEFYNAKDTLDKQATAKERRLSLERRSLIAIEAEQRNDALMFMGDAIQSFGEIVGQQTQEGKAIAAAGAIIQTYAAVTKALNTPGLGLGRIPYAVSVGAFGLAQVARIYRTNVPSKRGGSGGGGGSSPAPEQNPSFNIIGQSRDTQIRDTIEGALGKPIKAYVTTKDIKSGEELDRNTIRGARVG